MLFGGRIGRTNPVVVSALAPGRPAPETRSSAGRPGALMSSPVQGRTRRARGFRS